MTTTLFAAGDPIRPRTSPGARQTLASIFWSRIEESGPVPAQMVRRRGQWHVLTWSQVGEIVRDLALGLIAIGRERGETVALLSSSRAEWVQMDFAVLSAGCVTVPIYATYPPEQVAFLVNDSEARTLVVEDPAQLAKVLEVRDRMPRLDRIVVIRGYEGQQPDVLRWEELLRLGRDHAGPLASQLAERVAATTAEDVATIVYTSGTTGLPKGVIQTHGNHMAALTAAAAVAPVEPGDVHLLFLPLAHSFARLEAFMAVHRRLITAFAEGLPQLADNLREVRPHFIVGVPRVFEKLRERILERVNEAAPPRRVLFSLALVVGQRASRLEQAGRRVGGPLWLGRAMARQLVFGSLHRALGGRLRFAVSGGAPLPLEVADFFHAAGVLILEGYGLTESCPVLSFNRVESFRFGSVGTHVPGVELRIAPDGEILARGPNIAVRGYLKRPEETAETFDREGWLHTGDIGQLDEQGFLYITDRKKDLIVTSGGVNIAPQMIENGLRAGPLISEAMVYGDRRPYPVALLTLNRRALLQFAREQKLVDSDPARLAQHPKVLERVERIVEAQNDRLPSYARVKRFAVLPGEFSEAAGELTPTQKLRRKAVAERYAAVIESLYR